MARRDIAGWCEEAAGTTRSPGTPLPAASTSSLSSPLFCGAALILGKGRQEVCWPWDPTAEVEECWQGLAIPQILHICLQETSPTPGSSLQRGCITHSAAQRKGQKGRSKHPWGVGGGMFCLQSLCQS